MPYSSTLTRLTARLRITPAQPRRVLYITYNRASEGDWREQYYADKRKSFPPDCEREAGKVYEYKV